MIQIAICDDEPYIVNIISKNLDKLLSPLTEYNCYKFTNPEELIKIISNVTIDLLLIDIDMPDMNGFEVSKQMRMKNENLLVIFITNLDLYVYESLKYHPFRFIRKTHLSELKEAVLSAVSAIDSLSEIYSIHINSFLDINIKLSDIVYFESVHNDVKTITLEKDYTFRSTLKKIENDLSCKRFVRIHSAYILNVNYIYLIKNTEVEIRYLGQQITLPISRVRRNDLISEYTRILR